MWEKPFFSREQITENFDVSLRYLCATEDCYRDWTTDVVMNVDSLDVTLHRKQFIVLQSILDNQLADIRDVSATVFASLKQRKKTSSFLEVTYSRKWMCFFTRFCVVENKRQSNATFWDTKNTENSISHDRSRFQSSFTAKKTWHTSQSQISCTGARVGFINRNISLVMTRWKSTIWLIGTPRPNYHSTAHQTRKLYVFVVVTSNKEQNCLIQITLFEVILATKQMRSLH